MDKQALKLFDKAQIKLTNLLSEIMVEPSALRRTQLGFEIQDHVRYMLMITEGDGE